MEKIGEITGMTHLTHFRCLHENTMARALETPVSLLALKGGRCSEADGCAVWMCKLRPDELVS